MARRIVCLWLGLKMSFQGVQVHKNLSVFPLHNSMGH